MVPFWKMEMLTLESISVFGNAWQSVFFSFLFLGLVILNEFPHQVSHEKQINC
jgi:hypothetical protein